MANTFGSVILMLLAVVLLGGLLLALVAAVAGNILHVWGTGTASEWASEALHRLFARGLRRRFMRRINRQSLVTVDGARRGHPHLVASVSPSDVVHLTGQGGSLSRVAEDAARGYARQARAEGWTHDYPPEVAIVPEEWLRRGTFRVRPVSSDEFIRLRRAMHEWERGRSGPSRAWPSDGHRHPSIQGEPEMERTRPLVTDGAPAAAASSNAPTENLYSAQEVTKPALTPRILFIDDDRVRHEVTSGSVLIGRSHGCGVRLHSSQVSREHAKAFFQEGFWWLQDRDSRNGTTVDERPVKGAHQARLAAGSRIVLGSGDGASRLTVESLEGN